MEITLLGTSCMVPTKERNVSGVYVEYRGVGYLFDCGEGSQRQMNIAGINRNKVRHIFISHWHADHVAGLLGLLQTVGSKEKEVVIDIYGPKETKQRFEHLQKATIFDVALRVNVHEVNAEELSCIFEDEYIAVEAINLEHGVACLGFSLIQKKRRKILAEKVKAFGLEPGPQYQKLQMGEDIEYNDQKIVANDVTTFTTQKKMTVLADTGYCDNAITLSKDADVLISEATFASEQTQNAKKYFHLTSEMAAEIAKKAHAKKLVLTHISQRYKDGKTLVEQAKLIFETVELGKDFMRISL